MQWDDLKIARAVYRSGSFAAAAARLGINETTVSRRLARLEQALGVALFRASNGKRQPTAHCEEIFALTEPMAASVEQIKRVARDDQVPAERLRIAATDSVAAHVLAPNAASLLSRHPGLAIEFLTSTENVDFSRWEADLAVRLKRPQKGNFVISKVAAFVLYFVEPVAGKDSHVCAYAEDLDYRPESRHLAKLGLLDAARVRTKNLNVLKELICSGQFRGVLPDYLCRDLLRSETLRLTRLPVRRNAWLLMQRHLKDDATTRAVVGWIRQSFEAAGA